MTKTGFACTRRRRTRRLASRELCALALSVVIAATACAQQPRRFGAEYVPLGDGARRTYRVAMTNIDGRKIDLRTTVTNDGRTLINGREYVRQVSTFTALGSAGAAPSHTAISYFRAGADGVYKIDGKDVDAPEVLDLPLPIPTKTKWARAGIESQAEYAGDLTVGGRTYRDCLRVTSVAPGFRNVMYLAPRVGVVTNEMTGEGSLGMTMTLESYAP